MIRAFQGKFPQVAAAAFIAPDAAVIGEVTIERDASVWFQCVLRGDVDWIRIGAGSNIQDGTIVHVEAAQWPTRVGAEVTVGHRAILHGCTVEDRCLIGMGAILLNDVVVCTGSVVAAGSVLLEGTRVPPGSLVAGVPARVKRQLGPETEDEIRRSAAHYVELARLHVAAGSGT